MNKYVCLVKLRLESFVAWKLEHIPRGSNKKEDALAAMAVYHPKLYPSSLLHVCGIIKVKIVFLGFKCSK